MANLGVSGQLNLRRNEVPKMESSNSGFRPIAGQVLNKIIAELRKHEFAPQELAIVQTLLLGQRQDKPGNLQQLCSSRSYSHPGCVWIARWDHPTLLNHLLKPV